METEFLSFLTLDKINITEILTIIGSVVTGVITSILMLRKRLAQDNLEITTAKAEEEFISTILKERDNAIKDKEKIILRLETVDKEKHEMINSMIKITTEMDGMKKQIIILQELIKNLLLISNIKPIDTKNEQ